MKKALMQVTEFHRIFEHTVALDGFPTATPTLESSAAARSEWVEEEAYEILQAFADNSKKDLADGLVDLRYFALGGAVAFTDGEVDQDIARGVAKAVIGLAAQQLAATYRTAPDNVRRIKIETLHMEIAVAGVAALFGIPLEECFTYVHEKGNMTKLGADGKPIKNPVTGKIVKPEGWVAPDLGAIVGHGTIIAGEGITS